jgi:hypothetical protein
MFCIYVHLIGMFHVADAPWRAEFAEGADENIITTMN